MQLAFCTIIHNRYVCHYLLLPDTMHVTEMECQWSTRWLSSRFYITEHMRIFALPTNGTPVADEPTPERKILVLKVKPGRWSLEFISLAVINVKGR